VQLEGLGKLKEQLNNLIETQTYDLPACSIVPQPTSFPIQNKNVCRIKPTGLHKE
jgi:hypothetical protein